MGFYIENQPQNIAKGLKENIYRFKHIYHVDFYFIHFKLISVQLFIK